MLYTIVISGPSVTPWSYTAYTPNLCDCKVPLANWITEIICSLPNS